jgi:hypothetical protein
MKGQFRWGVTSSPRECRTPAKRSMVAIKESSRCPGYAEREYEYRLSWISKEKEKYENVESKEPNW